MQERNQLFKRMGHLQAHVIYGRDVGFMMPKINRAMFQGKNAAAT
jgi:hypothetical protein